MAPRKASTVAARIESAASKAQIKIDAAAHREYLLAQAGCLPETPPPGPKKSSIGAKKSTKKPEIETDSAAIDTATGNAEVKLKSPRNAALPKPRISIPAGDLSTSNSPEGQKSDVTKHDSATGAASKTKKLSKNRTVTATEEEMTLAASEDATPGSSVAKKSTSKKRKTTSRRAAAIVPPTDTDEDDDCPPAKKAKPAPRKPRPKTPYKSKDKSSDEAVENLPPPPPQPRHLNSILTAKVKRVKNFVDTVPQSQTNLIRAIDNTSLIHVPELSLIGALMCIRIDYELGDSQDAQLADVESIIVDRYTGPVGLTADQKWVMLDADRRTVFEDSVHEKISGHGLENLNLVEIELEMLLSDLTAPVENPSTPASMQAFYDQTCQKVLEKRAAVAQAQSEIAELESAETERAELEQVEDETAEREMADYKLSTEAK
ncbi:hypothetical protein LTR08_004256 [Meristemomyces frigidus]|nr:hypothetical protein LTR08_004256 [Meristemomyces frigidus]